MIVEYLSGSVLLFRNGKFFEHGICENFLSELLWVVPASLPAVKAEDNTNLLFTDPHTHKYSQDLGDQFVSCLSLYGCFAKTYTNIRFYLQM